MLPGTAAPAPLPDHPPSDIDPATLDELRRIDPAVLAEILNLGPAILYQIRNIYPAVLDENSNAVPVDETHRLCLDENQDGEVETRGSSNGRVAESETGAENENGNENVSDNWGMSEQSEQSGGRGSGRGWESNSDDGGGDVEKTAENLSRRYQYYPVRPEAEDCFFYLRTGSCKFGSNCKFNHPVKRKSNQVSKNKGKEKEEFAEKPRQTESKVSKNKGKEKEEFAEKPRQTESKVSKDKGKAKKEFAEMPRQTESKVSKNKGKEKEEFAEMPRQTESKVSKNKGKKKEEFAEKPRLTKSKNDFRSEGKGQTFSHSRGQRSVALVQENFMGLPIRPGEKECPHYMQSLSCKYGKHCWFNHPDPIAAGESEPQSRFRNGRGSFQGASPSEVEPCSAPGSVNGTPLYAPPTNSATETNVYEQSPQRKQVEELAERPGRPVHKSNFKHRRPKNQTAVSPSCELSGNGLPLRPGQNICTEYSCYGICHSGSSCKFDHRSLSTFSL